MRLELNYDCFVKWSCFKEPSLIVTDDSNNDSRDIIDNNTSDGVFDKEEVKVTTVNVNNSIISDYTNNQLRMAYVDALQKVRSMMSYMSYYNFISLVFNYALHLAIAYSSYDIDKKDDDSTDGLFDDKPIEALQKLYTKYSADKITSGIVNSTSSASSSSSAVLPKMIQEGNLETSYLVGTPYGSQAEIILESFNNVVL